MGTWGPNLYQNDTSLDVKDEFEKLYNEGKNVQEITDILTEEYKSLFGDIKEEPLFWLALADTQWEFGVLLPVVKEKALYWIDESVNMLNFKSINTSAKENRIKNLNGLRAKLLSTQPKVQKREYTNANGNTEMFLPIDWKAIWRKKRGFTVAIF